MEEINVHEIILPEKDEFSKRFNYVGKLLRNATDESLPEDQRKKWEDEYMSAKYCLEQGLPMSFVHDEILGTKIWPET